MAPPGPPVFDADTHAKLLELMAKGAAGGLFFSTDDCQASYEELKGRGVEFSEEPSTRPYGIDAAFRDPTGNSIRLVQST
jgi:predicted enzyme related to lactoylglutathione lyase